MQPVHLFGKSAQKHCCFHDDRVHQGCQSRATTRTKGSNAAVVDGEQPEGLGEGSSDGRDIRDDVGWSEGVSDELGDGAAVGNKETMVVLVDGSPDIVGIFDGTRDARKSPNVGSVEVTFEGPTDGATDAVGSMVETEVFVVGALDVVGEDDGCSIPTESPSVSGIPTHGSISFVDPR